MAKLLWPGVEGTTLPPSLGGWQIAQDERDRHTEQRLPYNINVLGPWSSGEWSIRTDKCSGRTFMIDCIWVGHNFSATKYNIARTPWLAYRPRLDHDAATAAGHAVGTTPNMARMHGDGADSIGATTGRC